MIKNRIKKSAKEYREEIISIRRHLHQYPELSFEEKNTSAFIRNKLKELNIPFKVIAGYGVVGLIKGKLKTSTNTIALRADIDALPITETNTIPFKSKNDGIMHACGHDVHMASLLGAATILSSMTEEFSGNIKLIFQPAEEKVPGGAKKMLDEDCFKDPAPKFCFAQHTMPELPAGKVGFRPGNYMASNDEFYINIIGKGGHAAMPNFTIDPIGITCQVISALQQLISRKSNPLTPSVLSIGRVIANGASNVIPDKVELAGTFRTMDESWRYKAHELIKKIVNSVVDGMGGKAEIDMNVGYPVLTNDISLTTDTKKYAEEYLGKENVVDIDTWMASEDFAYFAREVPSCYYRLGVGFLDKKENPGLHSSNFMVDESALETGAGLMTYLALKTLGN